MSRKHPTEKELLDKYRARVVTKALSWWRSFRPDNMTVAEHLKAPRHGVGCVEDEHLADACAKLTKTIIRQAKEKK